MLMIQVLTKRTDGGSGDMRTLSITYAGASLELIQAPRQEALGEK